MIFFVNFGVIGKVKKKNYNNNINLKRKHLVYTFCTILCITIIIRVASNILLLIIMLGRYYIFNSNIKNFSYCQETNV